MYINGHHLPFTVLQFIEAALDDAPPRRRPWKGNPPDSVRPLAYQIRGRYRRGSRADFSPLDAADLIEAALALSPIIDLSGQMLAALPANYDDAIPPLLSHRLRLLWRVLGRLIPLIEGLEPPPGTVGYYDLGVDD
jgi:hypothetical protein